MNKINVNIEIERKAEKFTKKAETLTTPELFTLGAELCKANAPKLTLALVGDIIWNRDGEKVSNQFLDAVNFSSYQLNSIKVIRA